VSVPSELGPSYNPTNRTFIGACGRPHLDDRRQLALEVLGTSADTAPNPSSFRWSGWRRKRRRVVIVAKAEYAKTRHRPGPDEDGDLHGRGLVIPALAGRHVDIAIGSDVLKPAAERRQIRIIAACGTDSSAYPHVPDC
jgi:hypothetical protein